MKKITHYVPRMKKACLIFLSILLIFGLCGCGDDPEPTNQNQQQSVLPTLKPPPAETEPTQNQNQTEVVWCMDYDRVLAFSVEGKDYYLTDPVSTILGEFSFTDEDASISTLDPYDAKMYTIYNNKSMLLIGVYNDTATELRMSRCRIGAAYIIDADEILDYSDSYWEEQYQEMIDNGMVFGDLCDIGGIKLLSTIGEIESKLGNPSSTESNNDVPYVQNLSWIDKQTEFEVAYDFENDRILGIGIGLRGVFYSMPYSNDTFSDNCFMMSRNHQYFVGEKLSNVLDTLKMDEDDKRIIVRNKKYATVTMYDPYPRYGDTYTFIVKNEVGQKTEITNCTIVGVQLNLVNFNAITLNRLGFAGGLTFSSSLSDLFDLYGAYDYESEDGFFPRYVWELDDYVFEVEFYGDSIYQITFCRAEDFEKFSASVD